MEQITFRASVNCKNCKTKSRIDKFAEGGEVPEFRCPKCDWFFQADSLTTKNKKGVVNLRGGTMGPEAEVLWREAQEGKQPKRASRFS